MIEQIKSRIQMDFEAMPTEPLSLSFRTRADYDESSHWDMPATTLFKSAALIFLTWQCPLSGIDAGSIIISIVNQGGLVGEEPRLLGRFSIDVPMLYDNNNGSSLPRLSAPYGICSQFRRQLQYCFLLPSSTATARPFKGSADVVSRGEAQRRPSPTTTRLLLSRMWTVSGVLTSGTGHEVHQG